MIDASKVKAASEAIIQSQGGQTLSWLPEIGPEELSFRSSLEVARRALVLNVLVNMSFGAPAPVMHAWLAENHLLDAVSAEELPFLSMSSPPDDSTRNRLRWNIESLWTAAWAGGLVDGLSPTQPIGEALASLLPDLRTAEPADAFLGRFHLRPAEEMHAQLDLFYRAHWHARECSQTGKNPGPFHLGVIASRRQLLEWASHAEADWDNVDLST